MGRRQRDVAKGKGSDLSVAPAMAPTGWTARGPAPGPFAVFLFVVTFFLVFLFPFLGEAAGRQPGQKSVSFKKGIDSRRLRDPFRRPAIFDDIERSRSGLSFRFSEVEKGQFVTRFKSGIKAVYTLHPPFQRAMKNFLKKNRVPYGVFIALDPQTGKILAMVEHSTREPRRRDLTLRAAYPAASIFKVVTASAAMEERGMGPDTFIMNVDPFHPVQTTLAAAFASSDNFAFAEIAFRYLNTKMLEQYAARFLFNRKIPFELPLEISRFKTKEENIARLAAGFSGSYLSPLHAALIGSAIANDGAMVRPCLVDHVDAPSGKRVFSCAPTILTHVVSADTAALLRQMMGLTVTQGTARKTFYLAKREQTLRDISMGGKTGSLMGKNPQGHVTWFVGMAPLEDPEVVVSALVINDASGKWRLNASRLAKEGFLTYFQGKRARLSAPN